MRRADRLFRIVRLRGGRLTTAAQLADKLEVTTRTIYRDVADLMASGVPIDGEAGLGYILRDGFHLPPLMFTEAEIVALVAGARMIRVWGGRSMAEGAEEALVKIEAVLPERMRDQIADVRVNAHDIGHISDDMRDRIDLVESAAANRFRLTFDYSDEKAAPSRRTVRPLGLWFWGQVWTMIGWCELRADFRSFRVDRMTGVAAGDPFKDEKGRTLRDFYATKPQERRRAAD